MDQEKIGKFIAECRKEKGLTQEVLAKKLNITKNAVSKWERGLSFPDVSLFKKICSELDISLEELINGEKDNSDNAKEKAMVSVLKAKNKLKKKAAIILTILSIIFVAIILGLVYYHFNLQINLITDSDYLYEDAIKYMKKEAFKNDPDASEKDFNVFYSYYGFGIEEKEEYKYAYMWIYSSAYFLEGEDSVALGSASSLPCKATFKDDKIINIEYPKDGSYYTSSIKEMFPKVIATQILNFEKTENYKKLYKEIDDRKYKYYDYLNLDMSKLTIDDITYDDMIFRIEIGNKSCVPVLLTVYKNNRYTLSTEYYSCKPWEACTLALRYSKVEEGTYDYDVMQIIKHSVDANNMQFPMDNLPKYEIYSGTWWQFITDDDNKYLTEFLESINVDLNRCAKPDYNN